APKTPDNNRVRRAESASRRWYSPPNPPRALQAEPETLGRLPPRVRAENGATADPPEMPWLDRSMSVSPVPRSPPRASGPCYLTPVLLLLPSRFLQRALRLDIIRPQRHRAIETISRLFHPPLRRHARPQIKISLRRFRLHAHRPAKHLLGTLKLFLLIKHHPRIHQHRKIPRIHIP